MIYRLTYFVVSLQAVHLTPWPCASLSTIFGVCLMDMEGNWASGTLYNQLDPLHPATGHTEGDANCKMGYSMYPGNINQVPIMLKH